MSTKEPQDNVLQLVKNQEQSDSQADEVLEECKGTFQSLMIIGWDTDGNYLVRSSGNLDFFNASFMAQHLVHLIHSGSYDTE